MALRKGRKKTRAEIVVERRIRARGEALVAMLLELGYEWQYLKGSIALYRDDRKFPEFSHTLFWDKDSGALRLEIHCPSRVRIVHENWLYDILRIASNHNIVTPFSRIDIDLTIRVISWSFDIPWLVKGLTKQAVVNMAESMRNEGAKALRDFLESIEDLNYWEPKNPGGGEAEHKSSAVTHLLYQRGRGRGDAGA